MNLRKKVFIAFLAFIIFPLIAIGIVTYFLVQHTLQEKYSEQSELIIKSIGRNISSIIKEANYYSDYWMLGDSIQRTLSREESIDTDTEIHSLLRQTFLSYSPISSVAIYKMDGSMSSSSKTSFQPISYSFLSNHPIFKEIIALNGSPRWIGPYENPEITGNQNLFTQIRVVNSLSNLEPIGYLYLQFQFHELDKIFRYYLNKDDSNNRFLLVNRQGAILYDNHKKADGQNIFTFLSKKLDLSKEYQTERLYYDGIESVISTHHIIPDFSGSMEWTLVSVTPWEYLSGDTRFILKWVGIIISLFLVSALLFNLFFVNRYIRFIIKLIHSMKRVEKGDLTVRLEAERRDETTILAKGFNRLVERVSTLLEEVKQEQEHKNKAELMLLQAQIKPHFLFNTLESINALAAQNQGKKVSQMVYRLGTILRISFHRKEEIPLSLELDYLKNYLEIQKYRFEELFTFDISLPASLESVFILKLTLQPLVENSIQHGFEGIEYKGNICIRAEEKEDRVLIWIEDNGIGIPEEVLSHLQYRSSDPVIQTESGKRIGLGITNVADRLRIHYGPGYGIYICSRPGEGTIIQCIIPKKSAR